MRLKFLVTFYTLSFAVAQCAFSQISEHPSQSEFAAIDRGEKVVQTAPNKDSAWPNVVVFTLIDCSPLEAIALFAAYEHQKNYVPSLLSSKPYQLTPTHVLVDYELKMPWPIENGIYTNGHHLGQKGDSYRLDWYQLKSNSADDVRGSAHFSTYKGKTLMRYQAFIKPKSFFAGIFSKIFIQDILATITSVEDEISRLKKNQPEQLNHFKKLITDALKGLDVYPKAPHDAR
jgi:hypothetical protein